MGELLAFHEFDTADRAYAVGNLKSVVLVIEFSKIQREMLRTYMVVSAIQGAFSVSEKALCRVGRGVTPGFRVAS
jgi:hypothetical protein